MKRIKLGRGRFPQKPRNLDTKKQKRRTRHGCTLRSGQNGSKSELDSNTPTQPPGAPGAGNRKIGNPDHCLLYTRCPERELETTCPSLSYSLFQLLSVASASRDSRLKQPAKPLPGCRGLRREQTTPARFSLSLRQVFADASFK